MVIFVARPVGTIDARICVADDIPRFVQSAMIVDPGSGTRATRTNFIIAASQAVPAPNGTRIGNLLGPDPCGIGNDAYDRYTGTVE